MYKIGDYVVRSITGICKIEDITHLDMYGADKKKLYYKLVPISDRTSAIYIPTDSKEPGMRKAMTENEVLTLIDHISEIKELGVENEKTRERQYKETVSSCDPKKLVCIIKTTYLRNHKRYEKGQRGTVIDEKYFKLAENNLYTEMGFVLHKTNDEIYELITDRISHKEIC